MNSKKNKNLYTEKGYLYLRAETPYVTGVVGQDFKLTLKQRLSILFSGGISICLIGKAVSK